MRVIIQYIYIYLYDNFKLCSSKSKYIPASDGALTRWRHHVNKGLHNHIEPAASLISTNFFKTTG